MRYDGVGHKRQKLNKAKITKRVGSRRICLAGRLFTRSSQGKDVLSFHCARPNPLVEGVLVPSTGLCSCMAFDVRTKTTGNTMLVFTSIGFSQNIVCVRAL